MRIVFMGTPEFAVPSLERLIAEGYGPIAVVTGEDKPRGRGRKVSATPVKEIAERHGITVIQPSSVKDPEFARQIADLAPDVIVVVAFRILPADVFESARMGAFNLHASLLPRFRGAAPIQRALMEGVRKTGVTTFFLKAKVDTGNIILQESIKVGANETGGELHDRLAVLGAELVVETVRLIEAGEAVALAQDDSRASAAPKIKPQDAHVEWSYPSRTVHNHIRALSPYPCAWCDHGSTRLKLYRSESTDRDWSAEPGTIVDLDGRIEVACATGSVLVTELQREGRGRMAAADFVNGYNLQVGDRLT